MLSSVNFCSRQGRAVSNLISQGVEVSKTFLHHSWVLRIAWDSYTPLDGLLCEGRLTLEVSQLRIFVASSMQCCFSCISLCNGCGAVSLLRAGSLLVVHFPLVVTWISLLCDLGNGSGVHISVQLDGVGWTCHLRTAPLYRGSNIEVQSPTEEGCPQVLKL